LRRARRGDRMTRALFAAVAIATAMLGVAAAAQPVPAAAVRALASGIEASNGEATIRVTALTNSILRVRIARGGQFPEDSSWAVPAKVRRMAVPVRATADGFATGAIAVHLDPATLGLRVTDLQGKTI